jgi:hypothetical protein
MSLRDTPDQFKLVDEFPLNTRQPLRWSLALALIQALLAGISLIWIQPVIPLLYSISNPQQQLVSHWWIFVFPALAFLFLSWHFFLIKALKNWAEIIIKLLAWSSVILQLLLTATLIRLLVIIW